MKTVGRFTAVVALAFLLACSDTFERTYKTRTEAEYDGAIAAGWVPGWLPHDAMQIRGVHTADMQATMLTFSYPEERELKVPGACTRIAASAAPAPAFERAWWPKSVPERGSTDEKYAYFNCGDLYVALRRSQGEGEGFVWSRK
jgi:hypothetical protein